MHVCSNYNTAELTPEDIFRHVMDQYGHTCPDALAAAAARDKTVNAMLGLIKSKGHMTELLANLGLCSLCHQRKAAR